MTTPPLQYRAIETDVPKIVFQLVVFLPFAIGLPIFLGNAFQRMNSPYAYQSALFIAAVALFQLLILLNKFGIRYDLQDKILSIKNGYLNAKQEVMLVDIKGLIVSGRFPIPTLLLETQRGYV